MHHKVEQVRPRDEMAQFLNEFFSSVVQVAERILLHNFWWGNTNFFDRIKSEWLFHEVYQREMFLGNVL